MENADFFCVKCLIEGDGDAFEALYQKYHRKIYHAALQMTRSEVLAQDVTQDVFLKVWENRSTLDPAKNFAAYIHVICRNELFDLFKKAACEESVKKELVQFQEISENGQEDDDFYETYKKLLYSAIAELPPKRREVFELCKLKEKKYDEVARKMNISRSSIQDHIVKANKFIREYMLAHINYLFITFFLFLNPPF